MLSHKILAQTDLNRVANYYEDSADDYYAKEGEASAWQGKGAEFLGLTGNVDRQTFRQLLEGKVSEKAKCTRSAIRSDNHTRIGIDFTFSAPKSVSLQALIGGDSRLIQAHDQAVNYALALTEERAQARQKIKGKSQVETTGNLIVATFRHETNREVDPQLHTHSVIMNLTRRQDGEWRALHNENIIKSTLYLGAVYRSELAKQVKALGYSLRLERDGMFELSHISRQQIEQFSLRSQQIEDELARQGLNRQTATTQEKQQASLKTRNAKKAQDRALIFEKWQQKAREAGLNFDHPYDKEFQNEEQTEVQQDDGLVFKLQEITAQEAARRAIRYAINHLTERQAVIREADLIETALEHVVTSATYVDIKAGIEAKIEQGGLIRRVPLYQMPDKKQKEEPRTRQWFIENLTRKGIDHDRAQDAVDKAIAQGRLVEAEKLYTTQKALEWERTILKIEREGREKFVPFMSKERVLSDLESFTLNRGQKEAAVLMATTVNQVVGVQGFAGVGKSHMLKAAKTIIERQGFKVMALAPYGTQVDALKELGVKAKTVASFLKLKDKCGDDRTLLVIDEAGVVPTRQMKQILAFAQKARVRVILMGDTGQTKAVEAGRPFEQLQRVGMVTARMEEIQRQQEKRLKEAVVKAAHGQMIPSLVQITSVQEIEDEQARYMHVTNQYCNLIHQERAKTLIVSGTNEARRQINALIRHNLNLKGNGVEVDMLIKRDSTQAERLFSKNYRINDVIQPEKDYGNGLTRGEIYHILETEQGNQLTVLSRKGDIIKFNPAQCRRLSVYVLEESELSIGDEVRITRNDPKLRISNGDRFTVTAIGNNHITLTNPKKTVTLSTHKPVHLDYAYATTVHSSQGITVDRVFIEINTASLTASREAYYVAISRARFEAHIVTDDRSSLPHTIVRENIKTAALDIRPIKLQKEHIYEHVKE